MKNRTLYNYRRSLKREYKAKVQAFIAECVALDREALIRRQAELNVLTASISRFTDLLNG